MNGLPAGLSAEALTDELFNWLETKFAATNVLVVIDPGDRQSIVLLRPGGDHLVVSVNRAHLAVA